MTIFSNRRHVASAARNYRRAIIDSIVIVAVLAVFYIIIKDLDLFEKLTHLATEREDLELDEFIIVALLALLGFTAFGARRLQDQAREVRARRAAEARARHLALADALTGLPNRRQFDEKLRQMLAALPGDPRPLALMMIDLDRFKPVNDVFGHAVGDQVLIAFARRASGLTGNNGFLARFGGDEFALLLGPLDDKEDASRVARRLISLFDHAFDAGGESVTLGTSIGIAMAPQDAVDGEELTRRADIALYRAKADGRGNFRFFEAEMDARVKKRAKLERDLRRAMEDGVIRPFYQPIVDLRTKAIVGFEALARWTHPELGEIPPEQFIGIAEDCGMITQLAAHLLHQACSDARRWPEPIKLAFNISKVQLTDPMLCLRVLQTLGDTGLSPHRLELEISESAMVGDIVSAKKALAAFHDAGVRIALDDFGTGNSSLNHLRECRFDRIKIDRQFVRSMADSDEDASFVRAIVGLSKALGIPVTAEGIESNRVIGPLIAEGCAEGQGFNFAEALPAGEALNFLAERSPLRSAG